MIKPIVRDTFFLSQKSDPAEKQDLSVGQDLRDTLQANRKRCVGMAANMIGVKKRIIIVSAGLADLVMVNPVITKNPPRLRRKKAAFPWTASAKRPGIRTSRWNTSMKAGGSAASAFPAGRPRSSSTKWTI